MLRFEVTYTQPQHHFIDFTFYIDKITTDFIEVQLPSWRPGRYEIANFAQNIQDWRAFDNLQTPLHFEKTTKDTWVVDTKGQSSIIIRYRYYAHLLNGGSTFLNDDQIFINPVNCFLYVTGREHEPIQIHLIIPGNYIIASQIPKESNHVLLAENFDELADSPLIASSKLKQLRYQIDFTVFNIWFQGEAAIDEKRLLHDFIKFTKAQVDLFEECECKEYDFLIQVLPGPFYHGVEHTNSSVNVIGPGADLMTDHLYNELIGLCSHELFHSWNVKRIRPSCMFPYNFKKENYCSLGYVYEGVTTYYGDLILLRSSVFSFERYTREVEKHLVKHFHNYGRYHQSVADSSTDTWLDGYVQGIPDRKVSIYTEGMLAALVLDAHIIDQTEGASNMDDLMRILYTDFYKEGKGYDEDSYKAAIENLTGHRYDWYFNEIIHGCGAIENYLGDAMKMLGVKYTFSELDTIQSNYGLKLIESSGIVTVAQVAPGSEAFRAGIARHDKLHSINDQPAVAQVSGGHSTLRIEVLRNEQPQRFELKETGSYFMNYHFTKDENASPSAKRNFRKWAGQEW